MPLRNEKITVILANNTRYAMTGGQMAPTTLPGESGPRLLAGTGMTVSPARAGNGQGHRPGRVYSARGSVGNLRQLRRFLKRLWKTRLKAAAFHLWEALSACPTNWRTNAVETWSFIEKEMPKYFKTGEIKVPGAGRKEVANG